MTVPGRSKAAVIGAGGYIGQHFARLLWDHPEFDLSHLVGSERSDGVALGDAWQLAEDPPGDLAGRRLRNATPAALARAGVRVAFSALPSGTAARYERELARRGIAVFSNAADLRGAAGVPLLIPEVNPSHLGLLTTRRGATAPIVNNPNCSATGLAVALAPILGLLRPRAIHVATYQSLSGAGYPGVASLSITDNVVPYIPSEEEKLAEETRILLGTYHAGTIRPLPVPVLAHCARVATRDGHLEAVTVEATRAPELTELIEAWNHFAPLTRLRLPTAPHPPVVVRAERDRPQPLRDRWAGRPDRARGMAVSVGRIRWTPPYLRFGLLSHNAVRGGAGGSVLNAEFLRARGRLPG